MCLDFMQQCSAPFNPPAVRLLPAKHDIATRMWKQGILLPIETASAVASREAASPSPQAKSDVLESATNYTYSAYALLAQIIDEPWLESTRAQLLENLGDLAMIRLRDLPMKDGTTHERPVQSHDTIAIPQDLLEIKDGLDELPATLAQQAKGGLQAQSSLGNSIGIAAIADWDLQEGQVWAEVAQDWYFQALVEAPGSGHIHLKLATLLDGKPLRQMYHYWKRCDDHAFDEPCVWS